MNLCRLSGKVHAGSKGDRSSVIQALELNSDAVQIADVKAGRRLRLQQAMLINCTPSGGLELSAQKDTSPRKRGDKFLQCHATKAEPVSLQRGISAYEVQQDLDSTQVVRNSTMGASQVYSVWRRRDICLAECFSVRHKTEAISADFGNLAWACMLILLHSIEAEVQHLPVRFPEPLL